MRKATIFKIVAAAVVLVPAMLFVHYFTPREVVVRISDTSVIRVDQKPSGGDQAGVTKDVYEIYTESLDRRHTLEFENEDFWPYLKFDSTKLQSQAAAIANSQEDAERVAAVSYIGWRIPVLSWFPNALSVKRVDPSYSSFPVLTFVFWGILLGLLGGGWFALSRWKAKRKAAREAREAAAAAARAERERVEAARRPAVSQADAADRFINGE
jgi:Protein of unknown function (DUF1523).